MIYVRYVLCTNSEHAKAVRYRERHVKAVINERSCLNVIYRYSSFGLTNRRYRIRIFRGNALLNSQASLLIRCGPALRTCRFFLLFQLLGLLMEIPLPVNMSPPGLVEEHTEAAKNDERTTNRTTYRSELGMILAMVWISISYQ